MDAEQCEKKQNLTKYAIGQKNVTYIFIFESITFFNKYIPFILD